MKMFCENIHEVEFAGANLKKMEENFPLMHAEYMKSFHPNVNDEISLHLA